MVLQNRESRARGKLGEAAERKLQALERKYEKDKARLEAKLEAKAGSLQARVKALGEEAAQASGLKRELKEKEAEKLAAQLAELPEAEAIEELKELHQDMVDDITDTAKVRANPVFVSAKGENQTRRRRWRCDRPDS